MMSNVYGIDVSSYNGVIDWAKVQAAGCGHAVLKITRKNLAADAQFAANIKGVKDQGIPYGVYRYVYESTQEEAEKAAQAVVALLTRYQAAPGTIVWWDVEDSSIQKTATTTLTTSILAAERVIQEAGFRFGVYCSLYWYQAVLQVGKLSCPFWIAAYGTNPVTDFGAQPARKSPAIGHALWGWQYSSRGTVPGIGHSTDLNVVYGAMNGKEGATKTMSYTYGSRGDGVKELQKKLNGFGYCLDEDGYFGRKTETAVKLYQKATGIKVDGICGKQTLAQMKHKLKMIVLAIKGTKSTAQPQTVQVGGVLHKVYAQGKQTQQRVYMANHGCGLCSAACAASTGGLDVTPQYLYERALALKPVKNPADVAISIWGIVKLLNSLGVSAKWYGLPSTAAEKEAAEKRIREALKAGKPVIITVQGGSDRLFTNSTAHTICLLGLNSKGLAVVANSNGKGPIQAVQIKSVVNHAIYGTTSQKDQLFWFGKKIYSVGYAVVGE